MSDVSVMAQEIRNAFDWRDRDALEMVLARFEKTMMPRPAPVAALDSADQKTIISPTVPAAPAPQGDL